MLNPYEPSVHTAAAESTLRLPMLCVVVLNFGTSLAGGAGVAVACRLVGASGDDIINLLVFFMSLAFVFGGAGAYLGYRYIQERAPLWAIAIAIGAFAIVLPLASPNAAPVINWIAAGLAAIFALLSTAIAGSVSSMVKSNGQESPG